MKNPIDTMANMPNKIMRSQPTEVGSFEIAP